MAFYKAYIKKGLDKRVIEFQADTPEEAEYIALEQGDFIIKLTKKKETNFFSLQSFLTNEERVTFLNTLATLSAALPLSEALGLIFNQFGGNIKRVASRLKQKLEIGVETEDAFAQVGYRDFPPTTVAMLKAGLSAGDMTSAFRETADFEREMHKIEKDSRKGIGLQISGFLFACFVILASRFWFVPYVYEEHLSSIIKNFDLTPINTFTDIVIVTVFFFLFFMFGLYFLRIFGRTINAVYTDKIISKVPLYRDLVLSKFNYITIYQLSKLIDKNIPLDISLKRTTENMPKGKLKNDFKEALKNLQEGRNWVEACSTFNEMDRAALTAAANIDNDKTARILKELSYDYKMKYKSVIKVMNSFFYWLTITYLSLAIVILFLYTSLPALSAISTGF